MGIAQIYPPSCVAQVSRRTGVPLDYLAEKTDKFSGADLTEICQRAAKLAIRESIEKDIERQRARDAAEADGGDDDMDDTYDPVPEITRRHFEIAMGDARRSVSDGDLAKYSSFAARLGQERAKISGPTGFRFPDQQGASKAADAEDDEEDLYS